jgi:hypothetical protein
MTIATRSGARAMVLAQINKLTDEYPHAETSELYDALITAGYDLKKARELINQAQAEGMSLSQMLAMYQVGEVRE